MAPVATQPRIDNLKKLPLHSEKMQIAASAYLTMSMRQLDMTFDPPLSIQPRCGNGSTFVVKHPFGIDYDHIPETMQDYPTW